LALSLGVIWILWLLRALVRLCRVANRDRGRPSEPTVPSWAYRQPDPLIYCQQYLQSQGLAVTWDNPDMHLELATNPGVAVDPHSLQPSTQYIVVAQVWNGSTSGPVADLPVHVYFLEFGIATVRHDVGQTTVDLPVKGAAGTPAIARVPWVTPSTAGHYCLQVELVWGDDANPANNLGQQNTDVRPLNSPNATFTFPVRNPGPRPRSLRLEADSYALPPPLPCPPMGPRGEDRRHAAVARHRPDAWPVPDAWNVVIAPSESRLEPGDQIAVTVDITAPDGFSGRGVVNINALDGPELVGGVTLYVEGTA
jgi:hypothetical protein